MSIRNLDRPLSLLPIAFSLTVIAALPASARPTHAAPASPPEPVTCTSQDGCAHTRATQVDASVLESTDIKRCGTGLVILGARLGFGGDRCPSWRITHPSRQECTGNSLDGHYCSSAGNLDVIMETCKCERYTVPFIEIGIAAPFCECQTVSGGHVEDFETRPCVATPSPMASGS
jgi:hypothetical protein